MKPLQSTPSALYGTIIVSCSAATTAASVRSKARIPTAMAGKAPRVEPTTYTSLAKKSGSRARGAP